ncbi:MAG: hypothetical protein ACXWUN_13595 [Allosphingosinicella sp.]
MIDCMLATGGLWLVLVVFMFLKGTRGPNRFGPDPRQPATADIFA